MKTDYVNEHDVDAIYNDPDLPKFLERQGRLQVRYYVNPTKNRITYALLGIEFTIAFGVDPTTGIYLGESTDILTMVDRKLTPRQINFVVLVLINIYAYLRIALLENLEEHSIRVVQSHQTRSDLQPLISMVTSLNENIPSSESFSNMLPAEHYELYGRRLRLVRVDWPDHLHPPKSEWVERSWWSKALHMLIGL